MRKRGEPIEKKEDWFSRNSLALLAAIILLAAALRFYALDSIPSLNQDEAVFGYEAFSIAETGRDEWGVSFPIIFTEFGGYSLPFYVYFLAPLVKLFGLGVFVTRFPSALFGVLLCVAAFFLARRLFDARTAAIAALLAAVSPQLVHASRLAFSAFIAPFFVAAGVFFLFSWVSSKRERDLLCAAALFSLSLYTYATLKVFLPLLLAGFAVLYRRELLAEKKSVARAVLLGSLIALPLLYASVFDSGAANARFDAVSVFRFAGGDWPSVAARNYASYFDLNYLFFNGDGLATHSAVGIPQIPWFALPLVLLAIALFVARPSREKTFLLWWLLVFPIAGALTLPAPHALRGATLAPLLQIFAAFSLALLVSFAERNWASLRGKLAAAALFLLCVAGFHGALTQLDFYYNAFPVRQAAWFSYGYEGAVAEANALALEKNASEIVVTRNLNQPYVFFLFFERYPPARFQGEAVVNEIRPGVWSGVRSFGGHRFCEPELCFPASRNAVFVVRGGELPGVEAERVVRYPDGRVAFKIIFKP